MRLVLLSHAYAPSLGGVETVTRILADRFHAEGHHVIVITYTTDPEYDFKSKYTVLRDPSFKQLRAALRMADAVIQSNITLNLTWPIYLARIFHVLCIFRHLRRKPFVTVLHSPLTIPGHPVRLQERLKTLCLRFGTKYAISNYLRQCFPAPCGLIPNPYAEDVFRAYPTVPRSQPLLFVGRLTKAKGCETAIEALGILHRAAAADPTRERPHLNIVGSGPDESELRAQATSLGLESFVHFLGPLQGPPIAQLMNEHTLLLVPSRSLPPEALAIVVLEGLACGCVPIVSDQGGLPEAIGPCGLTFPEGDAPALADRILATLGNANLRSSLLAGAPAHLARHRISNVYEAYKEALEREGLPGDQPQRTPGMEQQVSIART